MPAPCSGPANLKCNALPLWCWEQNTSQISNVTRSHFFKNSAKSGFEMCFAPSTFGAEGPKPKHVSNLDSVVKKFNPHFFYDCLFQASVCEVQNAEKGLNTYVDRSLSNAYIAPLFT